VDPNGLEPLDAVLQQFFNAALGDDFSDVGVNLDSSLVPRGYLALTFGRQVFLGQEASVDFGRRSSSSIALIGHELVHVQQYRALGLSGFVRLYISDYIGRRSAGLRHGDAYDNLLFEVVARQFRMSVSGFLEGHPDILTKLREGTKLSDKDLATVRDAFNKALQSSHLRPGLQFIQGVLVYVRVAK
jgi:hypothetical protein